MFYFLGHCKECGQYHGSRTDQCLLKIKLAKNVSIVSLKLYASNLKSNKANFEEHNNFVFSKMITFISIYTLSDLGVLSNLIGSLSLANEHYHSMQFFLPFHWPTDHLVTCK